MLNKKTDLAQNEITYANENIFFDQAVALYNKANYDAALIEFERLSDYDDKYENILAPFVEKCRNIQNIEVNELTVRHLTNQAILNKYQWVYYIKYLAGFLSLVFIALLLYGLKGITLSVLVMLGGAYPNNASEFTNNFNIFYLIGALLFLTAAIAIHQKMRKYTVSKGLLRCKYCGQFIKRINPNLPGFINNKLNFCSFCKRTTPMPSFYWDGWPGLEHLNAQNIITELEFYQEFKRLKEKYKKEYDAWRLSGHKIIIN
jgi:hypothetical protein